MKILEIKILEIKILEIKILEIKILEMRILENKGGWARMPPHRYPFASQNVIMLGLPF